MFPTGREIKGPGPGLYSAHLFTLSALSVAQPLYDLLTRSDHVTVFIAHQSQAVDIWLLVLLLSLLLPLAMSFLVWALNRISPLLGSISFLVLFFFLVSALFSLLCKAYLGEESNVYLAATLALAVIATFAYRFLPIARLFITLMSPAILLVPILFVANPNIQALLKAPHEVAGNHGPEGFSHLPNVVMLVFDELPLLSLMDANRNLDAERFPNFARLAAASTWYRNTTTIHYSTRYSIPSILTGTDHWDRFGRVTNNRPKIMLEMESFPENVFSLLEPTHSTFAFLSTTRITGLDTEPSIYTPPLKDRMKSLGSDLAVVYGHQMLPPPLLMRLPPIYGQWQDFTGTESSQENPVTWPYKGGKPGRIKQLIDALHRSNQPGLYVAHIVLPHHPFRYNEKGQLHEDKVEIRDDMVKLPSGKNLWPDAVSADLAYQAHLLQLGFVDRLLGLVLDRLEALGMFDDSLIVVTADHGISFYWDDNNLPPAKLYAVQASEVLYVPLMIKAPGQKQAVISDTVVQTVDILPTIADMMGVAIPWELDGRSILGATEPEPERLAWLPAEKKTFEAEIEPDFRALSRKISLFGTGSFDQVYHYGPHRDLIGTSVSDWPVEKSEGAVTITDAEKYLNVDPNGPEVPAYIEGEIALTPASVPESGVTLAIAVNGTIRGTSHAAFINSPGSTAHFIACVTPNSFRQHNNEIEVYTITEDSGGAQVVLKKLADQ